MIRAMGASEPAADQLNEETVAELLEIVRGLAAAENARTVAFDSESTWLGGFAGTILALTTGIGLDAFALSLDPALHDALVAFYVAGAALLAAAAAASLSVLLPASFFTIATTEIERYPFPPFVSMEKVMLQGRTLRGLIEAVKQERAVNRRKAQRVRIAVFLLALGLFCVLGQALILALHAA